MIFVLLTVTAVSYTTNCYKNNPSIYVTEVSDKNKDVLCIQINLSTLGYVDSLEVLPIGESENNIFIFNKKTRKATVDYYVSKEKIKEGNIFLKVYNNGEYDEYIQKINLN